MVKVFLVEWVYNEELKQLRIREIKQVKVKKDPNKLINFVEYKGEKIPIKFEDLDGNVFNVINVSGMFVPYRTEHTEIENLEEVKNKAKGRKFLPIKGAKVKIEDIDSQRRDEFDLDKPLQVVLKRLIIPIDMRPFFIYQFKRLRNKYGGFWEKYGSFITLVLFMSFSITMAYVMADIFGGTCKEISLNFKEGLNAFGQQLKPLLSNIQTQTPQVITPP